MAKLIWKITTWLGAAAGMISLVLLAKQGFHLGFIAPLQIVLDFYHHAAEFLFGWAEPYLRNALASLAAVLGVKVHLYSSWKYIFIPLSLYFGVRSKRQVAEGCTLPGKPMYYMALASWGIIIALVTSIIASTVPLGSTFPDTVTNTLFAIVPVLGIAIFELGCIAINTEYSRYLMAHSPSPGTYLKEVSWWRDFRSTVLGDNNFVPLLICAFVAAFALPASTTSSIQSFPNIRFAAVVILAVGLAIYQLYAFRLRDDFQIDPRYIRNALLLSLLICSIALVAARYTGRLPTPQLTLAVTLIISLACYYGLHGFLEAAFQRHRMGMSKEKGIYGSWRYWLLTAPAGEDWRLARLIFATIAGAALFILLNAGIKLAGI